MTFPIDEEIFSMIGFESLYTNPTLHWWWLMESLTVASDEMLHHLFYINTKSSEQSNSNGIVCTCDNEKHLRIALSGRLRLLNQSLMGKTARLTAAIINLKYSWIKLNLRNNIAINAIVNLQVMFGIALNKMAGRPICFIWATLILTLNK